jgi:hypothetical protein
MVKDWGYLAAFNYRDFVPLYRMAQYINKTHDTDLIEDINDRFERKADRLKNGVKIESVVKSEDLTLNVGIDQCINLIIGASSTRFQYMGTGAGTSVVDVTNTTLSSESGSRTNMLTNGLGWIEPQGMKLFYGAIRGETVSPHTITEIGVATASSGGTFLNREMFSSNQLSRTAGRNIFILSSVIEFCPKA